MSRDIRSFFQPKKVTKPKIEDDDIIPESPDVQIQMKKKVSRKKRVLSDDSDEEIFTSRKKKSQIETTKSNKNKKSPQKPALKEVKVSDLFGSAPVKRTEPLVKKEKKKTEVGIHSDDDFDQSLLELDVDNVSQEIKHPNGKSDLEIKKNDTGKIKSPDKKGSKDTVKSKDGTSSETKKESSSRLIDIEIKNEKKRKSSESDKQSSSNRDSDKSKTKESSRAISKEIKNEKKRKFGEVESEKQSRHNHDNSKTRADSDNRAVYNEIKNEKRRKFAEFAESDHKSPENDHSNENKKKKSNSFSDSKSHKTESNKTNEGVNDADDSDATIIEDYEDSNKHKKKKLDKSLNESVLTDEERYERRRQSAALYQHYLHRSGPKHLGAKEIPEGPPHCLKDCAFLLTGVLDSFERDEIVAAINKYGGSIKNGISKKVTHVLAGEDAGPAKMAKAQELGIKIINEDQFLQMIANPKTNKTKLDIKKEAEKEKNTTKKDKTPSKKLNGIKDSDVKKEKLTKKHDSDDKKDKIPIKHTESNKNQSKSPNETKKEIKIEKEEYNNKEDRVAKLQENTSKSTIISPSSLMWVDKYKPQNVKQIIGQHGDASNVKKLTNWLTKWYVNRRAKLPKPNPWAKNDDGGYYKAALLSGPPGVGKTTTVALVCKELGFDMVEFNASDTRNKTLIKEQIGELLTTTSLSGYAKGDTGKQAVTKKHVLVMDEVDGMAGNEDRGGLQELISLIKTTSVPIICMCNDRNSQKMRSFVNYCYDLRFSRPRVDQIKSAMMSICFKEGVKIPPDALSQLIVAAHQDVRQTLNLLSLWAAQPALLHADQLRRDTLNIKKDIKLGPWEAIRKVFTEEEHKKMSIHDKSDLFFHDYSLAPLFVQENYLQVAPHCPKNEVLDRVSRTADSISIGDMVDARIRRAQAWSLLPLQAMYSSVIPGHEMAGHMTGQINFPAWLGKNSRATKMQRLCQEIHAHTRLSTSGSKSSIFLDYCSHLRDAIVTPLIKDRSDGIEQALQILESYHLLRDDLDSLTEMSLWPGQRNPMILIDSKVKAAMTRSYNKKATALPYAPGAVKRGKARDDEEYEEDTQPDEEELQEDSDPENDALIKKKKADKPSANKEKPGSSKDKSSSNKEKASSSKEKKKKK